jgi:outer membrane receptor protein involved in Fe transport
MMAAKVRGKENSKPNRMSAADAGAGSRRSFGISPLAGAVIAALHPSAPALAQEDTTARLEEIIVTATKREINLQDVPHSIDVLSGAELIRMGARSMEDTIKALPSVALTATQPGRNSLVVRGISSGAFEYRTDAQVAVYLDEQPMTSNSQQVGVRNIDMARVESLAGPQGTLFGSSSQTGTIRYITNKPDSTALSGKVEGSYGITKGGEGSYDLSGIINLPLMEDVLAVRAVAYTSHDGGYVDNVFGTSLNGNFDNAAVVEDDFNDYDVVGGRVAALWNVSDRWSALLGVVAERNESTGTWETDPVLGDYKITRFNKEFRDDKWYSASLTLSGDLGFADLTLNATHFDRDIAYDWDNNTYTQQKDRYWGGGLYRELYNAGDPNYYNYPNIALYDTQYHRSDTFNDQTQQRDSIELRLSSNNSESRLQWMVGAYHEDIYDYWFYGTRVDDLASTRAWAAAEAYAYYYGAPNYYNGYDPNPNQPYPLPGTDVGYSNVFDRTIRQTALFGEVSYDLTDRLTATGGLRWAKFDRNQYEFYDFPGGLLPFGDRSTGDGSFRAVGDDANAIYKVSLRYNVNDDKMVYALYSQGFRLGGPNSPRAANTGMVPLTYNPDYLDNYEVGIKSSWLDGRMTINADAFLMRWSDYQQGASFDLWWLTGTVNAKSAETKGVEVQLDWQATDKLQVSANVFAAKPEFTEDFTNNGTLDVRAGMPMPNSPERKAFISFYYEIPDVFNGDLWFYYDFSYQSETWNGLNDIVNNNRNGLTPSATYSSLSTGWNLENGFSVDLNIRNLFDEASYYYVDTGNNAGADLFNDPRFHNIRTLDRPRTFWLTLRKAFGQ